MEGNSKDTRKEKETADVKKKSNFFKRNFIVILLVLLSGGAIALNEYDKKNNETINVVVDSKLAKAPAENQQSLEKLSIFVYNPQTKQIEEKEAVIEKQQNLIEGDYINEVIKASPFLTKDMKFLSAYNLKTDGKNTVIIKLNEAFSGLRKNKDLFDGFTQSIARTISNNFPNIQGINIQIDVKSHLDEKRYAHVERVAKCAKRLAKIYGENEEDVEVSAYLHDIAKFFELSRMIDLVKGKYPEVRDEMSHSTAVLHGFAGAEFVKNNYDIYGVDNEDILDGVRYHTIGSGNMSTLAKIVYLADAIEDGRNWEGVEKARKLAEENLDEAIKYEIDTKLEYLISKDNIIHPNIILFRNSLIYKK